MKISIITVVLNNKETVKDAILSVGSQGYHDIEHIVIGGKSVAGTRSVIDKYSDRLTVVISECCRYQPFSVNCRLYGGEAITYT